MEIVYCEPLREIRPARPVRRKGRGRRLRRELRIHGPMIALIVVIGLTTGVVSAVDSAAHVPSNRAHAAWMDGSSEIAPGVAAWSGRAPGRETAPTPRRSPAAPPRR